MFLAGRRLTDRFAVADLLLLCVAAVCLGQVADAASRKEGAFLILSRKLSSDLVEGVNLTINYEIHNVGMSDALTVQLKDVSFPASRFFLHSGSFRKSWPRLNSGSSLKLQVLTQPKRAGELLVSPAAVSYKDGDLSRMTRIVADDVMVVEDRISYRRRTERHGKTWLIYIASCGTAAGVPFLLYYRAISSLMPTPSSKKRS